MRVLMVTNEGGAADGHLPAAGPRAGGAVTRWSLMVAIAWAVLACGMTDARPAHLDAAHDVCATCRMVVSKPTFASQIVAPGEEPRFFDDMGCLTRYLASTTLPPGTRVYVADHRTESWVPAERAVFTHVDTIIEPMGSHIVAHETAASRDLDSEAKEGAAVDLQTVFAGHLPAGQGNE